MEPENKKFATRNAGMTVPDGYFEEFRIKMAQSLPTQPWETPEADGGHVIMEKTVWQKVRPYVYMAAMFAGIWLMMNMFSLVKPSVATQSIESNSVLMSAISDDDYYFNYCVNDLSDNDVYEELYEQGIDPSTL